LKFEPSDEHLAEEIRRLLRFEHGNKPGLR